VTACPSPQASRQSYRPPHTCIGWVRALYSKLFPLQLPRQSSIGMLPLFPLCTPCPSSSLQLSLSVDGPDPLTANPGVPRPTQIELPLHRVMQWQQRSFLLYGSGVEVRHETGLDDAANMSSFRNSRCSSLFMLGFPHSPTVPSFHSVPDFPLYSVSVSPSMQTTPPFFFIFWKLLAVLHP